VLDFENVALVGILNADSLLNFPDFRAHERSFQLMAQVAGRAGRKNKRGKVIIQTFSPAHYVIQNVASHNYLQMYNTDMEQRNNFNYPPFSKLILLTAKNPVLEDVNASADFLAGKLKEKFGTRVLGPEFPLIARIRNLYLKNILLKIEKNASLSGSKKIIAEIIQECKSESVFRKTRIAIDVDPV
jgi:primosomal protein N' (replication factor Y) (superfamily II helicase)